MSAGENSDDKPARPPLTESEHAETWMTYDEKGTAPWFLFLIWFAAMIGLGTYLATYFFPDLGQWL